jgi:hypothetical protein
MSKIKYSISRRTIGDMISIDIDSDIDSQVIDILEDRLLVISATCLATHRVCM